MMKVAKRVGIWMDHSTAHLMEYSSDDYEVNTIASKFTEPVHQSKLLHSENNMHNKENQSLKMYYKELMNIIKEYDVVLLYGPTAAKTELANMIREDHRFDKIKIETKSADKMNHTQQHAFIKDYFSKLLNYESPYYK
jgi:stalled ribosome rescue protein Dom34